MRQRAVAGQECYASCLLLYNTLPPNSSIKQYLLFHSSCGSEIRRGLAQGFWLKISQEVAVKLSARAADSFEAPTEVEDQLLSSGPCCPSSCGLHRSAALRHDKGLPQSE